MDSKGVDSLLASGADGGKDSFESTASAEEDTSGVEEATGKDQDWEAAEMQRGFFFNCTFLS